MTGYQIPRNSLAWMLIAQAGVIAPHVSRLPLWVVALCIGCGLWRVMVYQGRWSWPGKRVKVLFVLLGIVGVVLGYSGFGLEPAVGLLVVAFVLKLLEMQRKHDAYVVILLAFFVAMTGFLFNQTIPFTLYMSIVVTMITAALVGLNQTLSHLHPVKTFKTAGVLLGQSIPLMVVLFVFFPRVGPLWTVPLQRDVAQSGVSDTMSPGDISELAQSDELVFRATFGGDVPPSTQLYWRGLVLTRFDGTQWSQAPASAYGGLWRLDQGKPGWSENIQFRGNEVSYSIIIEPTGRNWLFSLTAPQPTSSNDMGMVRDARFYSLDVIRNQRRYQLTSNLDYRLDRELSDSWRARTTRLPESGNQRTRELAASMYDQAADPREYVNQVLQMFREQEFVYTLRPPALGENSIDEFLLETRRGFCEHYAGTFTFMMRAAGIPARVVVGYLGGEYNPIGDYVSVYEFDAHAWTEVWLQGEGWVRVDPTSAVAPARIESGLEAALGDEDSFLANDPLSWQRFRNTLLLSEIRLQIAAMRLYWDSWVIGYTPDVQMGLLAGYIEDLNIRKLGFIMLTVFFSVLGIIGLILLMKRSRREIDPVNREYLDFCKILASYGLQRKTGEAPLHFATRTAESRPDLADAINRVTDIYMDKTYFQDDVADVRELKRAVRSLKVKALTGH
ncbi:MAG: DUF3488 and transglutaminase-like domain-containing protein [Pseudomonadales bacterium]